MPLTGFGSLACTVRAMSEGKKHTCGLVKKQLSPHMCTYINYMYIYLKNLAKYLIKLVKVHRQSTGLAQTSDSITQVKEVHVLRSCLALDTVSKEKMFIGFIRTGQKQN